MTTTNAINTIMTNNDLTNVQIRVENNREVLNKRFIVVMDNNKTGAEAKKLDIVVDMHFARNGGVTGIENLSCVELSTLSENGYANRSNIELDVQGQDLYNEIMSLIYNSVHTEDRMFSTTYYNTIPTIH